MRFRSAAAILAVLTVSLFLPASARAGTIYTNQADFLSALIPGYDLEDFQDPVALTNPTPLGNGTYSYLASTPTSGSRSSG